MTARIALPGVLLLALAAGLALPVAPDTAGAANASRCRGADRPATETTLKQARRATRCLINAARRRTGARKVRINRRLTRAAQRHSNSMDRQDYFSHYSRSGASPLDRIAATGYLSGARSWTVGENLGFGTGRVSTPRRIVRGWLRSRYHRRTMLNRIYRDIGIGVAFGSPLGPSRDAAIYTTDYGYRR